MIPHQGDWFAVFRLDTRLQQASACLIALCLSAGGPASAEPSSAKGVAPGTTETTEGPLPLRFEAPALASRTGMAPGGILQDGGTDLVWRHQPVSYDARGRLSDSLRGNPARGLLQRYRDILMEETIRKQRRNPELFWAEPFELGMDHGPSADITRRSAERIFDSAHGEILSQMLDHVVESSEALTTLNARIRGIDLGFRTREVDPASGPYATPSGGGGDPLKVNLILSNRPRMELKARLAGGIKASVLVPLASPGVRATFSRPLFHGVSGALRAGVEDRGEDVWVSADLRFSF